MEPFGKSGTKGSQAPYPTRPRPEDLQRPVSKFGLKLSVSFGGTLVELEPSELLPHLARLLGRGARRGARLAAAEALHSLLRHVIGNDSVSQEAASDDVEATKSETHNPKSRQRGSNDGPAGPPTLFLDEDVQESARGACATLTGAG
eukprot:s6294_g2.t1